MAKTTSLAAQINKQALEQKSAENAEDARVARQPAPPGKVWVRLIRPCYDAEGVLHPAGIAALPGNAVPKSATRLTAEAAAPADDESDD